MLTEGSEECSSAQAARMYSASSVAMDSDCISAERLERDMRGSLREAKLMTPQWQRSPVMMLRSAMTLM